MKSNKDYINAQLIYTISWAQSNLFKQGRTGQAEDLAEKLRKIEVSLENETINSSVALAKVARLLKDSEICLITLLNKAWEHIWNNPEDIF